MGSTALDPLQMLNEENARVAAIFWEWRHKIMLLSVLTLAGVLGIASWLYNEQLVGATAVPFFFGAVIAELCRRFDRRIAEILGECYERGAIAESKVTKNTWAEDYLWTFSTFLYRGGGVDRKKMERTNAARETLGLSRIEVQLADREGLSSGRPKGTFTRALANSYRGMSVLMAATAAALVILAAVKPAWITP
jgi:hypothetical protein